MKRITRYWAGIACLAAVALVSVSLAHSSAERAAIEQGLSFPMISSLTAVFSVAAINDDPPAITDAVSREIMVFVGFTGEVPINDALSREIMVFVGFSDESSLNDAISREFALCVGKFADLNCDGIVNVSDLLILFDNWGQCSNCDRCTGDLNGDCVVNVSDLLILFDNWG
jgi:hypothetical protein